ncbi:hypothetical protein PAPHI01_0966 [Pancytospora philotis]|nr:hypothetical protein PAPHI01_0966 [Pancytospora philotis]
MRSLLSVLLVASLVRGGIESAEASDPQLASTLALNTLAVSLPNYADNLTLTFFQRVLRGIFWLLMAVGASLHLPRFYMYQIDALAATACVLFTDHIVMGYILGFLGWLPGTDLIRWVLLGLEAVALLCLGVNVSFRHIFGAVGVGYVAAYEFVLIFGVTNGPTFTIAMISAMICLFIVSKVSDFMFNCIVKAAVIPLCLYLAINGLIFGIFLSLHSMDVFRIVAWPCRLGLLLAIVFCFGVVFFQKQIQEKVHELADAQEEDSLEDV